jgi:hypothetical protein
MSSNPGRKLHEIAFPQDQRRFRSYGGLMTSAPRARRKGTDHVVIGLESNNQLPSLPHLLVGVVSMHQGSLQILRLPTHRQRWRHGLDTWGQTPWPKLPLMCPRI